MKLGENWVADSDVFTSYIEENYPNPPLATPSEKATAGAKIFSTFIGFLKSKDPNDGTEQALLNELSSFNDYIKENICPLDLNFITWKLHWGISRIGQFQIHFHM